MVMSEKVGGGGLKESARLEMWLDMLFYGKIKGLRISPKPLICWTKPLRGGKNLKIVYNSLRCPIPGAIKQREVYHESS
jgi:hypothetical protein